MGSQYLAKNEAGWRPRLGSSHTKSQALIAAAGLLSCLVLNPGVQGVAEGSGSGFAFTDVSIERLLLALQRVSWARLCSQPSSSQQCLLKRQSEPGNSCWRAPRGPLGHTWPSVSPATANLASSQRNSPLTQTAGKMTETIFLKNVLILQCLCFLIQGT